MSCQCATIGGTLQSGGANRMIIHLQTRLLHRRIELSPQLNFRSGDGNDTVAQCLLACRPAGVRRKLKPHPGIRQLRVRPHRYLVAIARLAADTYLIFETLSGLAHLIDPAGLASFHWQHRGGAIGQMQNELKRLVSPGGMAGANRQRITFDDLDRAGCHRDAANCAEGGCRHQRTHHVADGQ